MVMKSNNFRELKVWQFGMDLVIETYTLAKKLPQEERFALSDQMRRAAVCLDKPIFPHLLGQNLDRREKPLLLFLGKTLCRPA